MSGRGGTFFTVSGLVLLAYIWMRQSCPRCPRCELAAPTQPDPLSRIESTLLQSQLQRIKFLESENAELRKKQGRLSLPAAGNTLTAGAAAALPAPSTPGKRQWWYWTDLVMDSLRPFEKLNGGITQRGLRLAEQKCKISTWCHRAQVIDGRLYITDLRAIFFDRHYAMARVMPLLLTMKRWPVPNLDAVFSGTDYPIMEIPRDAAHMERMYGLGQPIPPVFSPTANTVSHDLPWPDFSFFPPLGACGTQCNHPLRTPRWQLSHPELLAKGRKVRWEENRRPLYPACNRGVLSLACDPPCAGAMGGQDRARRVHGQHEDLAQPADDLPPGAAHA